jgi:cytosine/adenosine deaminase-related metal-dependent hydrolase
MATLIQGGWVVGVRDGGHVLIPRGVVVYDGDTIVHVGTGYDGQVEQRLDARGKLVSPGLVNCHVHANVDTQIMYLEAGRRDMFGSIGLSSAPGRGRRNAGPCLDEPELRDSAAFAVAQLLRSGTTTFVEAGSAEDPALFAEVAGGLGARVYVAAGYQSGYWCHEPERNGGLGYEWDEAGGSAGLEGARDFVKRFDGSHGGRVRGMLMPRQIDTCRPELLRRTRAVADELGVRVQTHAAQYLYEFHEMLRRHARTPIEVLAEVGFLGPRTSIAHCIFTTAHPWTHLPEQHPGRQASGDLRLLAETGTSVVHCPLVFARRGIALHSFDRYREAGINVAIGTDTFPRDIIHEMRVAALVGKVVEGNFLAGDARDIFNAATFGGARLLGRDDLGRLTPGARADIIVVDLQDLHVGPTNDPIRTLIHAASGANVERVIVDGRTVVEGKRVVGLDETALLERVQRINEKLWTGFPLRDWRGRASEELFPPTFPTVS